MISFEQTMDQSASTAEVWMMRAYSFFEKRGIENPDPTLISAYVNAAALDHLAMVHYRIGETFQPECIASAITEAASEMTMSFYKISESLQNISEMLDFHSCGKPSTPKEDE